MKYLSTLILASFLGAFSALGQLSAFEAHKQFDHMNLVYHYKKSNLDGSNEMYVSLYIRSGNVVEVVKWNEQMRGATKVEAILNWDKFSVDQMLNYRYSGKDNQKLVASITPNLKKEGEYEVMLNNRDDDIEIDQFPWHSYDFEFASLNIMWPYLKDKKKPFFFYIYDFDYEEKRRPIFKNKGKVNVKFETEDVLKGQTVWKYSINGPGLNNEGGFVWINPNTWIMMQYQIEKPDEPGYRNGFLTLIETEYMEPGIWDEFTNEKVVYIPVDEE